MKIRDIISEAEEADMDRKLKDYFKQRELKKKSAELEKQGGIVGAIQRGNRWYNKLKSLHNQTLSRG